MSNQADQRDERFEFAGVIEGFYGAPWSHEDRLEVITFLGRTALDTYVYAPKNDPYHLTRWREAYPPDQLDALRELVDHASNNAVQFWYAISPGLSMHYGSQVDYQALLDKIDAVAEIGVTRFGLFLDDVPLQLQHEADEREFGSLVDAHVSLINRLKSDFDARGFQLMVTPTVYTSAWDDPEYIDQLGQGVHPDVLLVWTGPDVATDRITAAESKAWSERLRRRLVLWDNYPVNDFAPWRVFLGAVRGRDPRLPGSTVGILANPMNQAHASMIPLRTLSDYVEHPGTYDPERSLDNAVRELFGPEIDPTVRVLVNTFSDYATDDNLLNPLYFLRDRIELSPIERGLSELDAALDTLERTAPASELTNALVDELRPIVQRNRERLEAMRSSEYYREQNSDLIFAVNDTVMVSPAARAVEVDGSLNEWRNASWRALDGGPDADVAAQVHGDRVYMAIRVRAEDVPAYASPRIGEGAHVQLIIDHDHGSDRISPDDLFVLIAPVSSGPPMSFIGSMRFEGFMAKWLADNESLRLTEFHLTTFGVPASPRMARVARGLQYATRVDESGFTVELAFPYRSNVEHVSLTTSGVVDGRVRTASLASRNYPINPATFVPLSLR